MKNSAIAIAAIAALIGTPSFAADMAVKPLPPPAPAWSWTGFYIGGNAGYADDRSHFNTTMSSGTFFIPASLVFIDTTGTGSATGHGFTGGAQAGYNAQLPNLFVLGMEWDFDYLGGTPSFSAGGLTPGGTTFALTHALKPEWIATVRPRLGYAFDRTLVYATGGLAFVGAKYTEVYADSLPLAYNLSSSGDLGWAAGGGVEYSLNPSWSIRAEYLYAQFGALNASGACINACGGTNILSGGGDLRVQSVRGGLNYHF